ncbi:uncharacterized protein RAG0_07081 [Rhynchosporium agropyri]|uniref:Uncharacterized protein n=1 Tax=Rhynchosporium agropyri TaxID=914238 RepID=A0A1E1KJZ5_9HELO|nr:uncharacterized protein RAG0_07081 [Rhynchosporium agropyri]
MYGFAVAGPPGPTSKDQKIWARRFCPGVDAKSAPSRAVTITESNPNTLQSSQNTQLTSLASPFQAYSPEVLTQFTDTYDFFMLGPSSAWGMRVAYQNLYLCSPVLLHDILAVLWTTVKRARDNRDALNQSDVARGVVSLRQLRTARIENVGDTLAIFALGQTLAAFDLLTSFNSSTSILRYLLMSISPWYESVANNPTLDPVIFTSVSWDTLNCLVKRDQARDWSTIADLAQGAEPERIEKIQQEIFWWKPEPL